MRRGGRSGVGWILVCVAVAGCQIGTISPARLDAIVHERGGGFDQSVVALAVDLAVDDPATLVHRVVADPAAGRVEVVVRDPEDPRVLRTTLVRDGAVESSTTAAGAGPAVRPAALPLDRLDAMVDLALDRVPAGTAAVARVAVIAGEGSSTAVEVRLDGTPSDAVARFDGDGALLAFEDLP
ncbi:hypothetical protein [Euzebya sp.]|uniref:hypothetical protein n=1 Tax=Euzebya sp. TaxID=1971409 RepID=UPI0035149D93